MKKKKIKAIIFDVNGVLAMDKDKKSSVHESMHESMAKVLDVHLDTWFDAIDTTYAKSIEGKGTKEGVIKRIADNLDVRTEKLQKLLVKHYRRGFRRNWHLYKIAWKLKRRGYKIAILSDQWHVSKDVFIREKDERKFDVSVISCDVGMRKPNPKIYRLTLKKLKVKPSEAVFIDNRDWNTKPAKKLGIKTILFENNNQCLKELRKMGVRI